MNMNFDSLNNHDKERYVMELILRVLQSLGGEASKGEVKSEMAKMDEPLADYMDLTKEGKNGPYHPFAFTYNFAIKHLYYADYLTYGRTQPLKLTDKGINVDVDNMDFERDVYAISDEKWRAKSEENARKREERAKLSASTRDDVATTDDSDEGGDEADDEDDLDQRFHDDLLDAISTMSPRKFETLARKVLSEMGVTIDGSKGVAYTGDGGIDGYGYHLDSDFRTSRVAIQAKRWQGKVSSPEIDKFRGAMDKFRADYGIFITNSSFTKDAIDASREGTHMITLIDGDRLVELIKKYEVYVKPVTTYVLDMFYTD